MRQRRIPSLWWSAAWPWLRFVDLGRVGAVWDNADILFLVPEGAKRRGERGPDAGRVVIGFPLLSAMNLQFLFPKKKKKTHHLSELCCGKLKLLQTYLSFHQASSKRLAPTQGPPESQNQARKLYLRQLIEASSFLGWLVCRGIRQDRRRPKPKSHAITRARYRFARKMPRWFGLWESEGGEIVSFIAKAFIRWTLE